MCTAFTLQFAHTSIYFCFTIYITTISMPQRCRRGTYKWHFVSSWMVSCHIVVPLALLINIILTVALSPANVSRNSKVRSFLKHFQRQLIRRHSFGKLYKWLHIAKQIMHLLLVDHDQLNERVQCVLCAPHVFFAFDVLRRSPHYNVYHHCRSHVLYVTVGTHIHANTNASTHVPMVSPAIVAIDDADAVDVDVNDKRIS